jgi:riboflavin transporter FmnP
MSLPTSNAPLVLVVDLPSTDTAQPLAVGIVMAIVACAFVVFLIYYIYKRRGQTIKALISIIREEVTTSFGIGMEISDIAGAHCMHPTLTRRFV